MLFLMILFCTQFSPSVKFFYNYQEGSDKYLVRWDICQLANDNILVQSHSLKYILAHTVVCDSTFDTLAWEYEYGVTDTHYQGIRIGNIVSFKGMLEGENIERNVSLEPLPWLQFLGYSLARFAADDQEWIKFNCIRPENLKPYVMLAKKQGYEIIEINGIEYKTIRVRVSLTGLLSYFGGVNFWYRTSDMVFVKFEGLGLPWISKIIYELVDPS